MNHASREILGRIYFRRRKISLSVAYKNDASVISLIKKGEVIKYVLYGGGCFFKNLAKNFMAHPKFLLNSFWIP